MGKLPISMGQAYIAGACDLQTDITRADIARGLHLKSSSVHRTVQILLDKGVLIRRARIDFFVLGFIDIAVYFSVAEASQKERVQLEQGLVDDESTGWVGQLGGEYQYAALVLTQSLYDVAEFLERLTHMTKVRITDRVLAPRTKYTQYPRAYLSESQERRKPLIVESCQEFYQPDEIEHRILSHLGNNKFHSLRTTAQELSMPFSTFEQRFNKLRKADVIRGIFYEVNPGALAQHSFRLHLRVKTLSKDELSRFENFCADHRNIIILLHCFGSWDYEIGIEVSDASLLLNIVSELTELLGPLLISVKIFQEINDLKWTFYPFKRYPYTDRLSHRKISNL